MSKPSCCWWYARYTFNKLARCLCDAGNIQYTYQNGHATPIPHNTPCTHDIPTHNLPDLPDSENASVCTIGSIHDQWRIQARDLGIYP